MGAPRLDFRFAPIDLEILDHPRMLEACAGGDVTPFAVWGWTVIYVTRKKTQGVVTRAVINSALGGGDRSAAVAKLIAVGLFVELPDGRIKVWNHEKKSPKLDERGRTPGAIRQARHAAKKRALLAANDHSQPPPESVTNDVSTDVIPSTLSHLPSSGSDLRRSEDPPRTPPADDGAIASDLPLADDARAKYASLTHMRPLRTPVEALWGNFCDHFAGQNLGSRAAVIGRWGTWIRRQFGFDDRARAKARVDTRQPLTGPDPEWLTNAKTGTGGKVPF